MNIKPHKGDYALVEDLHELNILVVAPPYISIPPKTYGGVELVSYERAMHLYRLGFRIDFIAPKGSLIPFARNLYYCDQIEIEKSHSDTAQYMPLIRKIVNYLRFLRDTKAFLYIIPYIRCIKENEINLDEYDIIINDAFRNEIWNALLMSEILPKCKAIHILHSHSSHPIWTKIPNFFRLRLIFGSLNRDTHMHLLKHKYISLYTPNGIDMSRMIEKQENPEDYLLFIGRITPSKGVYEAIKVAKSLNKKLIIIGPITDQQYYSKIKPYIDQKNIVYLGNVSQQTKYKLLKNALALVFTSRVPENYPMVLLEALSYGVPIVALYPPHPTGFYDIVNERFCVCGNSITEIIKNFKKKIYNIDRNEAIQYAKINFSWETIIKRHWLPSFNKVIEYMTRC